MHPLWRTVALILLVLFVPGSVHCVPGTPSDSEAKGVDSHLAEFAVPQGDASHTDSHECVAKSLAATQLPSVLKAPSQPDSDFYSLLPFAWAMSFGALLHLTNAELGDGSQSSSIVLDTPQELRAQWAFVLRSALPARLPSDLV